MQYYPHREQVLSRLERIRASGRLGQPLLLTGPEGVGKEATVLEFARRMACVAPRTCTPAAPCESCAKALTFQHPDILWIGPAPARFDEDDARALFETKRRDPFYRPPFASTANVAIGDSDHPGPMTVRHLIRFLQQHAFQAAQRVAIVADSQRLNTSAANAFLKTLEEPPEDAVIILLATGTEGMLPTILSRCQEIRVQPWPLDELTALLCDLQGVDEETAAAAAAVAAGNARRATALLQDISPVVRKAAIAWAQWILEGRRGLAAILADEMHRGVPPHILDADEAAVWKAYGKKGSAGAKTRKASEAATAGAAGIRRDLAIQLCEWLVLLYSEVMKHLELGDKWRPRVPEAREFVVAAAGVRRTDSVLKDMELIEKSRGDIDRNLNIGLLLAVLGEGLIANAEKDRTGQQGA